MTAALPTPTPWTFDEENLGIYDAPDARGAMVRIASIVRTPDYKANASFIVQACNAHDALVEAVEAQLEVNGEGRSATYEQRVAAAEKLAKALKLARGKA